MNIFNLSFGKDSMATSVRYGARQPQYVLAERRDAFQPCRKICGRVHTET